MDSLVLEVESLLVMVRMVLDQEHVLIWGHTSVAPGILLVLISVDLAKVSALLVDSVVHYYNIHQAVVNVDSIQVSHPVIVSMV
jgi:hypothetical protein